MMCLCECVNVRKRKWMDGREKIWMDERESEEKEKKRRGEKESVKKKRKGLVQWGTAPTAPLSIPFRCSGYHTPLYAFPHQLAVELSHSTAKCNLSSDFADLVSKIPLC